MFEIIGLITIIFTLILILFLIAIFIFWFNIFLQKKNEKKNITSHIGDFF